MQRDKIIFYVATGLLSLFMLGAAGNYFFNYESASGDFAALGFPLFIVYPLGVAKVLGLVAIWSNLNKELKYLAYAGYFYNFILALLAHLVASDGQFAGAAVALVLLAVSFIYDRKLGR